MTSMTLRERLYDYMTTVRPTADSELTPNGPALTNSDSRPTVLRLGFFTESYSSRTISSRPSSR